MRSDCRHYQSRTYGEDETVRKCALDLAPEAPWRCPEGCASFEPRLADVAWSHGSLVAPATPEEPASVGEDDSVASLLDEAEDIINRAAPDVLREVGPPTGMTPPKRSGGWRRWFRRPGGG